MKKKKTLYIISAILLTAIFFSILFAIIPITKTQKTFSANTTYATTMEEININMNNLMTELEKEMTANPELSVMGSPISLIENSQSYKNIIKLGLNGVKPLYDKLYDSKDAGLYEYILSLAIEDITQEKFVYNKDYGWKNSLEFRLSYEAKVNNTQTNVEKILNSDDLNNNEKISKLKEQGIFAISFLMNEYNNNDSKIDKNMIETVVLDIANSYKTSTEKNITSYSINNNELTDIKSIQENSALFDSLVDLNGKAYDK